MSAFVNFEGFDALRPAQQAFVRLSSEAFDLKHEGRMTKERWDEIWAKACALLEQDPGAGVLDAIMSSQPADYPDEDD